MSAEIFAAPALAFAVSREDDGSIYWNGSYHGMRVETALPINDGARCVILLDPGASDRARFENLFCIARDGRVAWTAELPDTHDCFVHVQADSNGLRANSWSGYQLQLDPKTGETIGCVFTK